MKITVKKKALENTYIGSYFQNEKLFKCID